MWESTFGLSSIAQSDLLLALCITTSWQSSVSSIRLDSPLLDLLLVRPPKHQLQMLALAFLVLGHQDPDRKLEDVEFRDAGTGVTEGSRRRGIDGKGGDLGDGIPTIGGDAWEKGKKSVHMRGTRCH